ncbi:DUF2190 family protein [Brevibacterium sp. RIT 803]|uniref:DUF2190 family protein n=1 Tax=Brevibacterium sp. RIT 803 TaxID=2810210 RepID=UPI0019513F6F|nr:DUF2190 family protein [Brevibacterium sp. RIT 803]MBM6588780.1 DUF2190 family protein [Brevibacterium sp. RIT 803]
MAKNQLYPENKHIAVVADKDYTSGQPAAIGAYRGVVLADAAEGEQVTVWLNGSYKIDVAGALTVGQVVYLAANGTLTATAGATAFGVANVAKATGTGPAEVAPFGMIQPAPPAA